MKKYLQLLSFVLISHISFCQNLEIFDIYPVSNLGSSPYHLYEFNDKLYFRAYHPDSETDLWVTDGTQSGTQIFKNLNPEGSSYPGLFMEYKNSFIFTAWSNVDSDYVLWISDGTPDGTSQISNVKVPSSLESFEANRVVYNDLVFFRGSDALYATDGTESGTQLIKNNLPQDIISFNNYLFFSAFDNVNDRELWISDGTTEGSSVFLDIDPEGSSVPMELTVWNNHLYFNADDGTHDRQLWKSDGTTEGTIMLTNIFTNSNQRYPTNFTEFNDELYFVAGSPETSKSIWKTNGTVEGTQMVFGKSSDEYFNPQGMIVFNDKLYFSAYDTDHGSELWVTDGTEEGTYMFLDIFPGTNSSNPLPKMVYNNKLYFIATEDMANGELSTLLWETNGTLTGTTRILPDNALDLDIEVSKYNSMAIFNESLYFGAKLTEEGKELWKLTTYTGVEENQEISVLNVTPNPTSDYLNISLDKEIHEVVVYNLLGEQILNVKNTSRINISHLKSGNYMVQVKTKDSYLSKSFIKVD